jgi:hypothetical protein
MEELREEFEIKRSAPKKLRGICRSYRTGDPLFSDSEEESSLK